MDSRIVFAENVTNKYCPAAIFVEIIRLIYYQRIRLNN